MFPHSLPKPLQKTLSNNKNNPLSEISSPDSTQKLILVHDTIGQNWLADGYGNLGIELQANNYFVSNAAFNWGPAIPSGLFSGEQIGNHNKAAYLWEWFKGNFSSQYLSALYSESSKAAGTDYSRLPDDPGGENTIIVFTLRPIDTQINGNPNDPPAGDENLLKDGSEEYLSVSNIKRHFY